MSVSWLDLVANAQTGVSQQRMGGSVRSDSTGAYVVCGVPGDVGLRLAATADSAATGILDLLPNGRRVQRRDLLLGIVADSGTSGTIAGRVRDAAGQPIAGARIVTDGRRNADRCRGRFVVLSVPSGTRQVDALAIGSAPATSTVDVLPGDTVVLNLQLTKATALDAVQVSAKETSVREHWVRDIEERRKFGLSHFMDSLQVSRHADMRSAISEFPNYTCLRRLWIDGIRFTRAGHARRNSASRSDGRRDAGVVPAQRAGAVRRRRARARGLDSAPSSALTGRRAVVHARTGPRASTDSRTWAHSEDPITVRGI